MAKLSAEEKERRAMQRKADGINARKLRDVGGAGSLFAAEAGPDVSAEDAYWVWRRQKAMFTGDSVYNLACRRMDWVRLGAVEAFAASVLGADGAAEVAGRVAGSFGGVDYRVGKWRDILTGRAVSARLEVRESPEWASQYNREGRRVFEVDPIPAVPTAFLSDAEFDSRFPAFWRDTVDATDDDPAGLFPLVMAALSQGGK